MNTGSKFLTIVLSVTLTALAGCSDSDVPPGNNSSSILDGEPDPPTSTEQVQEEDILPEEYTRAGGNTPARMAIVSLQPTEGNTTSGMVAFIQANADDAQVRVVGRLVDIPQGVHGFHIHENGNCSASDATTAGEHFNPTNAIHGDREGPERHAGDLGNLTASAEQVALLDFYDDQLSFSGVNSFVGKAFIVHAMPDDLVTQPSGNSGDRIACGVIELQQSVAP
jgi:Cu-Zn family superoxide dismutase